MPERGCFFQGYPSAPQTMRCFLFSSRENNFPLG
jgi:hypothetical protein